MTSNETVAVTEAVNALHKAILSYDKAGLDSLTDPELVYGHTSGRHETKQQFIDGVMSGRSAFSKIEMINGAVKVIDNVALVHHVLDVVRHNPPPGNDTSQIKIMAVWMRRDGQWKLVSRQAVKLK